MAVKKKNINATDAPTMGVKLIKKLHFINCSLVV